MHILNTILCTVPTVLKGEFVSPWRASWMGGNFLYSRDLYVLLRSGNREKLDASRS